MEILAIVILCGLCVVLFLRAGIAERSLRSAADAAADQHVDILIRQEPCQGAMSDAIGADHFAGNDLIIFHLIYLKKLCPSKMLKNVSIVICYRYFHLFLLLTHLLHQIINPEGFFQPYLSDALAASS